MSEIEKALAEKWEEFQKDKANKAKPGVLLLGITGAGKSSLINKVFGKEIAEISDVAPATMNFKVYKGSEYGIDVNLVDSTGYELSEEYTYYGKIRSLLKNGIDELHNIHVIWYCISVTNERIEDIDTETLLRLCKESSIKQRVCVVFTKCDNDDQAGTKAKKLKSLIQESFNFYGEECPIQFFETSNQDSLPLELPRLVEWTANQFTDEDFRNMFISSQMVDLRAKEKAAESIIKASAAAASAIGAIPIPVADAMLLVPLQIKMLNDIIEVYGLEKVALLSKGVVAEIVMTQLGRTAASTIIKFIPIIGQIAGAFVNATVAGSLTYALGRAVSYICRDSVEKALNGEQVAWNKVLDFEEIEPLVEKFYASGKEG